MEAQVLQKSSSQPLSLVEQPAHEDHHEETLSEKFLILIAATSFIVIGTGVLSVIIMTSIAALNY